MTIEAWNHDLSYVEGDQALVNNVPCQVVVLSALRKTSCRHCPLYESCRDSDDFFDSELRTGCISSLGDSAFWVPIEAMPLLRLKGEL